jgi:hypothetical protein
VLLLRRRSGLVFAGLASLYAGYVYYLVANGTPTLSMLQVRWQQWASLAVIAAAVVAIPWDLRFGRAPAAERHPTAA